MSNEARKIATDFLNTKLSEQEVANKFDLKQCEECNVWFLEEELDYNDIHDKHLCEACNDELKGEWA